MHMLRKLSACLLAAALLVSLFALPAVADVSSARNLGDGSIEIQWDNMDDMEIYMVSKMSDDFDADLKTYGFIKGELDTSRRKFVNYWMAPGQSYWLYTRRTDGTYTTPLKYEAARTKNFEDFRSPPRFTEWQLMKRDMQGKTKKIGYLEALEMEQDLEYTGYGAQLKYTWVRQTKELSYLCHVVIVTPDGERIVKDVFQQDLPKGLAYAYNKYLALENFFSGLLERRGEIPVGQYIFSIYWDNQLVCSTPFNVR